MADLTSYSPTVYSSNTDQFGSVLHGNNDMSKLMVTAPEADNKGKVFIYNYSSGNFTFYSLITAAPFASRSAGDGFGTSLALSAVFGTSMYFVGMPGKSRVYVYENPGTPTASQTYVLSASDSNVNVKEFGSALALSGRNLVVGCARNSESVANGGACYYYRLTGGIAKYAQLNNLLLRICLQVTDSDSLLPCMKINLSSARPQKHMVQVPVLVQCIISHSTPQHLHGHSSKR